MKQAAQMENYELARTFNCGIGMLISVRPEDAENILQKIHRQVRIAGLPAA